jgi:hypothetical protein
MEQTLAAVGAPVEPTVRRYPLDIVNAGEDTYIVMSKGHHDPHEFMRAVRAEGYEWPLGMPEHKWARAVPTKEAYRSCIYVFTEPHARGAFPATYSWEAYGDDRYEVLVAPNGPGELPASGGSARPGG